VIFLFAIFAQWFSRGFLFQLCLGQENGTFLFVVFFVAFLLGAPVQGYMSDVTSRKKVILGALAAVVVSLLIVSFGPVLFSPEKVPVILGVAAIINGVFGNASPAATAALWDNTGNRRESFAKSFSCRYSALLLAFVLPIAQRVEFFLGLSLAAAAFVWVLVGMEEKERSSEAEIF